ncbi:MAG: ROK family protein [Coriobacteriales bacterium]|nr:ROK family protein [Coriobacteriales bacterium]
MAQYLVLDIGGTFIKYAIMDDKAQFIEQGKVPAVTNSEEGTLQALSDARDAVAAFEYEGVAISMPGRINTKLGIAHTGGAFQWIHNYPAAKRYGAVFGKPCTIANDGKCAASAENWIGALADVNSGAVLVLGTGIGGGIVINNSVWMGNTGGAGELSAFITDHSGAKNGLGWGNIGIMWASKISAGSISGKYAALKGLDHADGVMLFDAYEAGDPIAQDVLRVFGEEAAAGICSLQSVLDLERYAIGGGISARPETTQIIRDAVDALFDPHLEFLPFGKPEIVTCKFGNEANLIGALAFHLGAEKSMGI